jgi:transcriptional regulator with XRE-family HTH domain
MSNAITQINDKMSTDMVTEFSDWLMTQIAARGITQSQLARLAGVSRQVISDYINGKRRKPDEDVLKGIAHALKIPPEIAFREAGLLPQRTPEYDQGFEEWMYLLNQLPEKDRQELLEIARLKIERAEREEKGSLKMQLKGAR